MKKSPSLPLRLAIICYDILLLIAVSIAYGYVYLAIASLFTHAPVLKGFGFQLGWLVTIASFYSYFWIKGGQTTGMRAWKIKIRAENQQGPTLTQCLVRLFFAPIGWLLFFTVYFDPKKQYLHERLSGTQLYSDR